jgi:Cu-Zn family superoxide dismutase
MKTLGLVLAVCLLLVGYRTTPEQPSVEGLALAAGEAPKIKSAIAVLYPTIGNKVTGTVRFNRTTGGVRVSGQIEGLEPGEHGFHIHEFGDCSAPDAESAGGHFNPEGMRHGARNAEQRHIGDLGNVTADGEGRAVFDFMDKQLGGGSLSAIIGRAVVVHADLDDFKTQPSGKAGARVACGVIAIAKSADAPMTSGGI